MRVASPLGGPLAVLERAVSGAIDGDGRPLTLRASQIARLSARTQANASTDEPTDTESAEDLFKLAKGLHMRQGASEVRAAEVLYRRCLRLSPTHGESTRLKRSSSSYAMHVSSSSYVYRWTRACSITCRAASHSGTPSIANSVFSKVAFAVALCISISPLCVVQRYPQWYAIEFLGREPDHAANSVFLVYVYVYVCVCV